jgi:hypothetical protein
MTKPAIQKTLTSALLSLALCAGPAFAADDLWFHVKVREKGGDNANVTLNIPMSFVQSMMPMVSKQAELEGGRIAIDNKDVSTDDLRRVLTALKDSPDATFAEVETDNEKVIFYKQGEYLRAETREGNGGAEVNARFPIAVLDALLSGNGNELNLEAALAALVEHGPGDLVTIRDGETSVRVWIDRNAEMTER